MSTAGLFNERALDYDFWYSKNKVTAINEVRLVKSLMHETAHPCIEIGVGSGYFASKVNCHIGLDPSIEMLRLAQRRKIEVILGRAEKIPLLDNSMGTVLIIVSICFMDNPHEALQEVYRILKKNGSLITCIVPSESPWGMYYRELGAQGHPFYSLARFFTLRQLMDIASNTGFRVESIRAILTYAPWEEPRPEEPVEYTGREGFVCVRFRK